MAERSAVIHECIAVQDAEKPAKVEVFAVILERFSLHFPENRWSPEERRLVLQDWRRLLGDLPADILQSACDAYVMTPARWFPTPGQLYEVAKPNWTYRKRLADRAAETMELIQQQAAA